jgi:hypothetical protein
MGRPPNLDFVDVGVIVFGTIGALMVVVGFIVAAHHVG